MYLTHVRFTPSGTSCSALQATVQAWQPMHVSWSMRKPKRVTGPAPYDGAAGAASGQAGPVDSVTVALRGVPEASVQSTVTSSPG